MLARRWFLCALIFVAPSLLAQWVPNQLKQVVVLTRHGVRSPLSPMQDYAKKPWPDIQKDWQVECCGDLTPRGASLVTLLGAYYRSYYADKNLLLKTGCPANQIYIWADNEERTLGTARALVRGLAGRTLGCRILVHSLLYQPNDCKDPNSCQRSATGNQRDLWFHPLPGLWSKVSKSDHEKIQLVVDDIKSRYGQLLSQYRPQLQALQNTLLCCTDPSKCDPNVCKGAPCNLLCWSNKVAAGQDSDGSAVKWEGPFSVGSTATEVFLLEYANGMPCRLVGWSQVIFSATDCSGPGEKFRQMQEIHTAYFQEVQRPLIVAQIQGSNLAKQILTKLQQAVSSPEASPKLVIFSGHDTNIANVAALLKLSWKLPDLPENDTPPAGALVFELYTGPSPGNYKVRVRYVHQTVRQLRSAVLSLADPPNWVDLPMRECNGDCSFDQFNHIVGNAIRPEFVTPEPNSKVKR